MTTPSIQPADLDAYRARNRTPAPIKPLTFLQFQQTRSFVPDLRPFCADNLPADIYQGPQPGNLYAAPNQLFIHQASADALLWCVEIGNSETTSTLAKCEAELYAFYLSEVVDDAFQPYLKDIAPPSHYAPRPGHEVDTEASLVKLHESFCAFHDTLTPASADEMMHALLDVEDRASVMGQISWLKDFIDRWDNAMERQDLAKRVAAPTDPFTPRIVVVLGGGCLRQVFATEGLAAVKVDVIDYDNLEGAGMRNEQIDEIEAAATRGLVSLKL